MAVVQIFRLPRGDLSRANEKTARRRFFVLRLKAYFFEGGKSVQLPCATSAAMPMLSPKVGCG